MDSRSTPVDTQRPLPPGRGRAVDGLLHRDRINPPVLTDALQHAATTTNTTAPAGTNEYAGALLSVLTASPADRTTTPSPPPRRSRCGLSRQRCLRRRRLSGLGGRESVAVASEPGDAASGRAAPGIAGHAAQLGHD